MTIPFIDMMEYLRKEGRKINVNVGISETIFRGKFKFKGLRTENTIYQDYGEVQKDLLLLYQANHTKGIIECALEYRSCIFTDDFANEMAKNLRTFILNALEKEDSMEMKISEMKVLSKEEERKQIYKWNETIDKTLIEEQSIVKVFQKTVLSYGNLAAVEYLGASLTYNELWKYSCNVAVKLQSRREFKTGEIVGICIEKSDDLIICIIGILISGGICLPIDHQYPHERTSFVLEDTKCSVLICSEKFEKKLRKVNKTKVMSIMVVEKMNLKGAQKKKRFKPKFFNNEIAYVIFTSGSTAGKPKGVLCTHIGIVNVCQGFYRITGLDIGDRFTLFCSVSFDVSILEIFCSLLNGMCLIVIPEEVRYQPRKLHSFFNTNKVNGIFVNPSMLKLVPKIPFKYVKCILIGGESCDKETMTFWVKKGSNVKDFKFINGYGPSECSITSHRKVWDITMNHRNIGTPYSNCKHYILDDDMNILPIGVIGELCIGGVCVSPGYHNREELNKIKFVSNPFCNKEKIYRSGDLCRFTKDGDVLFIERKDFQIKINGYRIELDEIESSIRLHAVVKDVHLTTKTDHLENTKVVAFTIIDSKNDWNTSKVKEEIRKKMMKTLPSYMVQNTIIFFVDKFPRNISGKIDDKKLKQLDVFNVHSKSHHIQTSSTKNNSYSKENLQLREKNMEIESVLKKMWKDVLKRDDDFIIGIDDDFFDIGGTSVMMTSIISLVGNKFGVDFPLLELFVSPTIRECTKKIEQMIKNKVRTKRMITKVTKTKTLPLSFAQERLYFICSISKESSIYTIPYFFKIKGNLNIPLLEKAIQMVINRHEILRTTFHVDVNNSLFQKVENCDNFRIKVINIKDLNFKGKVDGKRKRIEETISKEFHCDFSLVENNLFRVIVIMCEDNECMILFVIHHIIFDLGSFVIVAKEISTIYNTFRVNVNKTLTLSPVPLQYGDFALWEREYSWKLLPSQLDFWKDKLENISYVLKFPTDFPRSEKTSNKGNTLTFTIPNDVMNLVKTFSKEKDVTTAITLLTIVQVIIHRYTNQKNFAIGMSFNNRHYGNSEGIVGFFVNILPFPLSCLKGSTFANLISANKKTFFEIYEFQDTPFQKIVEHMNVKRNNNVNPLFQVSFQFNNEEESMLQLDGLKVEDVHAKCNVSKFDLSFNFEKKGEKVLLDIEYSRDLWKESSIRRIYTHLLNVLKFSLVNPLGKIVAIPLLSKEEFNTIVYEWNKTDDNSIPLHKTLIEVFEEIVNMNGNDIAVEFEDDHLTYNELNNASNKLARYLINVYGVKTGDFIGICVEKSLNLIVSILAVLKSGAAVCPIDHTYPNERLSYIFKDTDCDVCIINKKFETKLSKTFKKKLVRIDSISLQNSLRKYEQKNLKLVGKEDDCSFIIYTSGSTGIPKGVVNLHRGCVNVCISYFRKIQRRILPSKFTSHSLFSSISFDTSILEIFTPLLSGIKLIVIPEDIRFDPVKLHSFLNKRKVVAVDVPPVLLKYFPKIPLKHTKLILIGGEVCDVETAVFWSKHVTLINGYGPTEVHICSHEKDWKENDIISNIGKPSANYRGYVLDENMNPVPIGVSGIMYCGGKFTLTRGYLNNVDLTKKKFVSNPFVKGELIYRTGDVCKLLENGDAVFLGREDFQVKLRGFRIELGETEHSIRKHPRVKDACSMIINDLLISFVIVDDKGNEGREIEKEIRIFAEKKLPKYMLPSSFIFVDNFPLNTNGKVDRKKIKGMYNQMKLNVSNKNIGNIESEFLRCWKDALNIRGNIDIRDNFFDVGGNSIMIVKVYNSLKNEIRNVLSIADLHSYQTIEGISHFYKKKARIEEKDRLSNDPIPIQMDENNSFAIVGMSCNFPGAKNLEIFWKNLLCGNVSNTFYQRKDIEDVNVNVKYDKYDPNFVPVKYDLKDFKCFDNVFFNLSKAISKVADPQFKVFLQLCYHCFEDANIPIDRFVGEIGLFCCLGDSPYLRNLLKNIKSLDVKDDHVLLGYNSFHLFAGFVAKHLGIKGPCFAMNGACSTSLMTVQTAINNLKLRKCDLALAGGISITHLDEIGYLYRPESVLSSDGFTRTFDANSSGTTFGDGGGVVLIKRLEDALANEDKIYACIKGSSINNDGNFEDRINLFSPSIIGQTKLVEKSIIDSKVNVEKIRFVEAHGTATRIGDVVEISALKNAFGKFTKKKHFCYVGAVKQNIGHLDCAAGIAGLIKACMVLRTRTIPKLPLLKKESNFLKLKDSPFILNKENVSLKENEDIFAVINSIGLGGNNASVILENYKSPKKETREKRKRTRIFLLSAKNRNDLKVMGSNLIKTIEKERLEDVAYTLQSGRKYLHCRRYFISSSKSETVDVIKKGKFITSSCTYKNPPVVCFMFPGMGSLYYRACIGLYEEIPSFKSHADEICFLCKNEHDLDLLQFFQRKRTKKAKKLMFEFPFSHLLVFVVEYSLSKMLIDWNIIPDILLGHSLGDYVSCCISGIFSPSNAIKLIIQRMKLIEEKGKETSGLMMSILSSEKEIEHIIKEHDLHIDRGHGVVEISLINSPQNVVVSGSKTQVMKLKEILYEEVITCKLLKTKFTFHCSQLHCIQNDFASFFKTLNITQNIQPSIPIISPNMNDIKSFTSSNYWTNHMSRSYNFINKVHTVTKKFSHVLFIELGISNVLCRLMKQNGLSEMQNVISLIRHPKNDSFHNDVRKLYDSIGQMWIHGVFPNWIKIHEKNVRKCDLPLYPFEKTKCYEEYTKFNKIKIKKENIKMNVNVDKEEKKTSFESQTLQYERILHSVSNLWKKYLNKKDFSPFDSFFSIGGDSLLQIALITSLKNTFKIHITANDLYDNPTLDKLTLFIMNQISKKRKIYKSNHIPLVKYKGKIMSIHHTQIPHFNECSFVTFETKKYFPNSTKILQSFVNSFTHKNDYAILNCIVNDLKDQITLKLTPDINHNDVVEKMEYSNSKNLHDDIERLCFTFKSRHAIGKYFFQFYICESTSNSLQMILLCFNSLVIDHFSIMILLRYLDDYITHYHNNEEIDNHSRLIHNNENHYFNYITSFSKWNSKYLNKVRILHFNTKKIDFSFTSEVTNSLLEGAKNFRCDVFEMLLLITFMTYSKITNTKDVRIDIHVPFRLLIGKFVKEVEDFSKIIGNFGHFFPLYLEKQTNEMAMLLLYVKKRVRESALDGFMSSMIESKEIQKKIRFKYHDSFVEGNYNTIKNVTCSSQSKKKKIFMENEPLISLSSFINKNKLICHLTMPLSHQMDSSRFVKVFKHTLHSFVSFCNEKSNYNITDSSQQKIFEEVRNFVDFPLSKSIIMPLLERNNSSALDPLFVIHTVYGISSIYIHLANDMGNSKGPNVYGINYPFIVDQMKRRFKDINEMAKYYANELEKFQKKKKFKCFQIAGYSISGVFAYYVAKELIKRGKKVSKLIIIDTEVEVISSDFIRLNETFVMCRKSNIIEHKIFSNTCVDVMKLYEDNYNLLGNSHRFKLDFFSKQKDISFKLILFYAVDVNVSSNEIRKKKLEELGKYWELETIDMELFIICCDHDDVLEKEQVHQVSSVLRKCL